MNQRRTASETRELVFEACGRILRRDGLCFAEMHHYVPPDAERRAQIVDLIMQLTHDSLPIQS